MAKTFGEYLADVNKETEDSRKRDIAYADSIADAAIESANKAYDEAVYNTHSEFESAYERNAVQKLINEKQIAERNANLGLGDSGLNHVQQDAVKLSYENQKEKIDDLRKQALDKLSDNLSTYIASVNEKRESDKLDVNQYYDEQNIKTATEMYNANFNNKSDKQNAVSYGAGGTEDGNYILRTSGGLLSRNFWGTLSDNDIDVIYNGNGTTTYVDNNSGKKTTLSSDINPFTGTRNKDVDHGVFKNGYQPNNINGQKLTKVENAIISVHGNQQSVWFCNGDYYAWNGAENKYNKLTEEQVNAIIKEGDN